MRARPYKTADGALRAPHGCSGVSRAGVVRYSGGWALALWWGPASAPSDARLVGRRGRVLADGVRAVEAALGL